MAAGTRDRLRGGGNAGGPFRVQIRGGRKLGGGGNIKKVGDDGITKLGAREGRIEGNGDQIEEGRGWILVRGCHIGCAGLCINSQGKVYTPNSEDEDLDMEMDDVAVLGVVAVMVPVARSPTIVAAADAGRAMVVATDGAPGMMVAADRAPGMEVAADRAPDVELAPEVLACLQVVLVGIDPIYHAIFTSFYKVMVPAFFKSN
uniref:Uncharacterized protein n=1 Tax=Setaria viridis TaxID=4556 RepID=A0A4U6V8R3_SETVI|nr:hypothetical protein SEVIR_3G133900v2 [Setaria viridis]